MKSLSQNAEFPEFTYGHYSTQFFSGEDPRLKRGKVGWGSEVREERIKWR